MAVCAGPKTRWRLTLGPTLLMACATGRAARRVRSPSETVGAGDLPRLIPSLDGDMFFTVVRPTHHRRCHFCPARIVASGASARQTPPRTDGAERPGPATALFALHKQPGAPVDGLRSSISRCAHVEGERHGSC